AFASAARSLRARARPPQTALREIRTPLAASPARSLSSTSLPKELAAARLRRERTQRTPRGGCGRSSTPSRPPRRWQPDPAIEPPNRADPRYYTALPSPFCLLCRPLLFLLRARFVVGTAAGLWRALRTREPSPCLSRATRTAASREESFFSVAPAIRSPPGGPPSAVRSDRSSTIRQSSSGFRVSPPCRSTDERFLSAVCPVHR
ncbi:Prolyl oligopeptidase family protein, partial [Zea mays]